MEQKKQQFPWMQYILLLIGGSIFINLLGNNVFTLSIVAIVFILYGASWLSKRDKKIEEELNTQIESQGGNKNND